MEETIHISKIKINEKNPRSINKTKLQKLKDSIEEFPKMMTLRPIVVDADGTVLGGNMRARALIELGYKEIPSSWVKKASELTDDERRRFVIADNVGFGDWDWEIIAKEWPEAEGWGLEVKDWFEDDDEAADDDYVPPSELVVHVKVGDLIEIGKHRLLCGDSTSSSDVEKLLNGEKVNMYLTDPPYGVAYVGKTKEKLTIQNDAMSEEETHQLWENCVDAIWPHLKKGGAIYATVPAVPLHLGFAQVLHDRKALRQILVWNKDSMVLGRSDYHYKHEPILYGWKPGAKHYFVDDRTKTSVLDFDRPKASREHPTMKPIELWGEMVKNGTKPGGNVYDSFCGSGTTIVTCHQTGRTGFGMEIDPKYCQIIIDRMRKLDGSIEIKINGEVYE